MKSAAAGLALLFVAITLLPMASAHLPLVSHKVYAFSNQNGSRQSLFLEGNQSNMEMFKNWSIVIEGQGTQTMILSGLEP